MSGPLYTKEDMKRFDRLTSELSSQDQMTRISARIAIKNYVAEHGKEKCDAMFAALAAKDGRK